MLKQIIIFCTCLLVINFASGQKRYHLTIKLDSSINPQKVSYHFYDGKDNISLPDTFSTNRTVVFSEKYYSPRASFHVSYNESSENSYFSDFFIDDKPAEITLYRKRNKDHILHYKSIKNATPIFDTVDNQILAGLYRYLANPETNKHLAALEEFSKNNTNYLENDSITRIFHDLYKKRLNTAMEYLAQHSNEYFSFWYFINQIAQPSSVLANDVEYLKEQQAYVKRVFPSKFTNSIEGESLMNKYAHAIRPLEVNDLAPPFTIRTIDSTEIKLKDLKGKNVMLIFWATWCPPCMAEIPFLKDIRKKHPVENLEMIGVNADLYLKPMKSAISEHGLNWPQYFDREKYMSNLYGVSAYPQIILIDKEGKVIHRSNSKISDEIALPKVLEKLK